MSDWKAKGLCRPPEPGQPSKVHDWFFLDVGQPSTQARELCGRCPVQADCLNYAVTSPVKLTHGIWGGKTEREIRVLRARRLKDKLAAERASYTWKDGECPCGAPAEAIPSQKFQSRHYLGHVGVPKSRPCEAALACKRMYEAEMKANRRRQLLNAQPIL